MSRTDWIYCAYLVTIVCLIGGGLGLLMWHKVKASGQPQPST